MFQQFAAIRIPKYANLPESPCFEFRPPDATCKPYLAAPQPIFLADQVKVLVTISPESRVNVQVSVAAS